MILGIVEDCVEDRLLHKAICLATDHLPLGVDNILCVDRWSEDIVKNLGLSYITVRASNTALAGAHIADLCTHLLVMCHKHAPVMPLAIATYKMAVRFGKPVFFFDCSVFAARG